MQKVIDWAMHTLLPYARGGKVYNPSRFDAATVKEAATALEVVYDGYMPQKSDKYSLLNVVDKVNKNIQIINSYEALKRSWNEFSFEENKRNENEIKKCKILIEGNDTTSRSRIDPYIEEAESIMDRTEKWKKDRQMIDMIIKCIQKYY